MQNLFKHSLSIVKSKIFFTIVAVNFLILTALVIIYQVISLVYINNDYRENLSSIAYHNAVQSRSIIDNQIILTYYDVLNDYFSATFNNDKSLGALATSSSVSIVDIIDISDFSNDILTNYNSVKKIDLYMPDAEVFFSNGEISYIKDNNIEDAFVPLIDFFNNNQKQRWAYNSHTHMLEHYTALPYINFDNSHKSAVCMGISINDIAQRLSQDTSLAILHSDSTVLYSMDNTLAYPQDIVSAYIIDTQGSINSTMPVELSPTQMIVKSEHADIYYIISIDTVANEDSLPNLILMIVLLNVSLLAVFSILSYFMLKKAHSPLANIISTAKSTYAQPNVDDDYSVLSSVVKNAKDMRDSMSYNKSLISDRMIEVLLNGNFSKEWLEKNYNHSELCFLYERVAVVIIKILRETPSEDDMKQQLASIRQISGDCILHPLYSYEQKQIKIIVNLSCDIQDIISQLCALFNNYEDFHYNMFIGDVYDLHEQNISLSMQEAMLISNYSYIMLDNTYLTHSYFASVPHDNMPMHTDQLEDIKHAFKSKNIELVASRSIDYIESLISFEYDILYIQKSVIDLIMCIKLTVNSSSISPIAEVNNLSILTLGDNVYKLSNMLQNSIFPAIINHYQKISENETLEHHVIRLINDTSFEDITLEYVASALNMHSSTFSKAFKSMTNVNFIDYIKNKKLEYAESLLIENKLSVNEITAKLGYNTPHYFIKIFKKKYGVTPKKYQSMHMRDLLTKQSFTNDNNNKKTSE